MRTSCVLSLLVIYGALVTLCHAGDELPQLQNPVELFNGKDLRGWVPVNVAPSTFSARDGIIVSTGVPTGVMRTQKQYENFLLELDWMHVQPGGNAGLFVWSDPLTAPGVPFTRAIEVQILDGQNGPSYTSHGDLFSIHGAVLTPDRPHPGGWMRSLPTEQRCNPAGEWNHYQVQCKDGTIKLAVNGKVVSGGSKCSPRKGYICLESEGTECHFKNIRIQELPSSNPPTDETAPPAENFHSLYTGIDLAGWKQDPGHAGHWAPEDWTLKYDGRSTAEDKHLWTEKEYGNFVMVCDWRMPREPVKIRRPVILSSGEPALDDSGKPKEEEVLDAGDSGIYLRGDRKAEVNIWSWPIGSGEVYGYRNDKSLPAETRAAVTPNQRADNRAGGWNRFVITMNADRLTVVLNGKTVVRNAQLPGIPAKGPIGLQHHGHPIEFANLFIKELED
jgi:hypothetical protein